MSIYFKTSPTKKTEQESFSSSFFPSKNLDIFLNFSSKPFDNLKLHMKSAQNKGDIFNNFLKHYICSYTLIVPQDHGEIIYGGTRRIEDDCSATFSEYIFLFPACLMISHWLTKNAELNSVF